MCNVPWVAKTKDRRAALRLRNSRFMCTCMNMYVNIHVYIVEYRYIHRHIQIYIHAYIVAFDCVYRAVGRKDEERRAALLHRDGPCINLYVNMYTHVYIYVCVCVCVFVYIYICMYSYIYLYIYTCIYIHIYIYIYIYINVYIYMYIYIYNDCVYRAVGRQDEECRAATWQTCSIFVYICIHLYA